MKSSKSIEPKQSEELSPLLMFNHHVKKVFYEKFNDKTKKESLDLIFPQMDGFFADKVDVVAIQSLYHKLENTIASSFSDKNKDKDKDLKDALLLTLRWCKNVSLTECLEKNYGSSHEIAAELNLSDRFEALCRDIHRFNHAIKNLNADPEVKAAPSLLELKDCVELEKNYQIELARQAKFTSLAMGISQFEDGLKIQCDLLQKELYIDRDFIAHDKMMKKDYPVSVLHLAGFREFYSQTAKPYFLKYHREKLQKFLAPKESKTLLPLKEQEKINKKEAKMFLSGLRKILSEPSDEKENKIVDSYYRDANEYIDFRVSKDSQLNCKSLNKEVNQSIVQDVEIAKGRIRERLKLPKLTPYHFAATKQRKQIDDLWLAYFRRVFDRSQKEFYERVVYRQEVEENLQLRLNQLVTLKRDELIHSLRSNRVQDSVIILMSGPYLSSIARVEPPSLPFYKKLSAKTLVAAVLLFLVGVAIGNIFALATGAALYAISSAISLVCSGIYYKYQQQQEKNAMERWGIAGSSPQAGQSPAALPSSQPKPESKPEPSVFGRFFAQTTKPADAERSNHLTAPGLNP